jgi:hypothetical protein
MALYKVTDQAIYIQIGDVRSEWLLIPLDNPEDQRRLLSMQLTGAWMSEAIEMDVEILSPLSGRCGRYPSSAMGGATWMGLIADTNMPSENSPWHKFMETDTPPDAQVFIQPGGMDADAENLDHLTQTPETLKLPEGDPRRIAQGRSYYERFVRSNNMDWVRRYVHAKFGDDPSGSAVFRESFKSSFHVVPELEPLYGSPLIVGQDFGRDPWSVICQVDLKGRLLILEEVEAEDIGLEQHVQRSLRPALLKERYFGRAVVLVGDPAGISKDSIYEETSFDVLKRMGFVAYPAPTNDIDPRIRAVEAYLLQQRDGGPALLVDRLRCPTIVRGLGGGYRYAKMKSGARKALPDKNRWSHPMDGVQYVALAAHGGMSEMIARRLQRPPNRPSRKISPAAWT